MVLILNMRALIQRVTEAKVRVDGETVGSIGQGFLILLGVGQDDSLETADSLAARIAKMRLFENPDGDGKSGFDLDIREIHGQALVVSQFTLHADTKKGRRPSFSRAARPEKAEPLYEHFCKALSGLGVPVQKGVFRAMMEVHLINDGPVTINLETT